MSSQSRDVLLWKRNGDLRENNSGSNFITVTVFVILQIITEFINFIIKSLYTL